MLHSACCHGVEGRSMVYEGLMDDDNVEGSKTLRCFSDLLLDKARVPICQYGVGNIVHRAKSY